MRQASWSGAAAALMVAACAEKTVEDWQPVSPAELEEAYLVNALVTLWNENWGVYGVRKL